MNISVICSNYNSSLWIKKYLSSLNNQFLEEFEVVFVDANSTDESIDIIDDFKFRDGIKKSIFKYTNRISVYEAWNVAIKKSIGDFVVNYNTDDFLFKSALLIYQKYLLNNNADIIYGPYFIHSNNNPLTIDNISICPEHQHEILKLICYCGPFPCVRKFAIESVGFFDLKYKRSADYDMWLRLSYNNKRFLKINEPIGSFFYRPNSVSNENIIESQLEDKEIQSKY